MECSEDVHVRQDEIFAKALQHPLAVVLATELERRHAEQPANVPAEALRRGVVESIGDASHGQSGVLEELRRANEARRCQIALGRG